MAVPYTFANTPNGSTIPLAQLDANFAYVESQIGGGITPITSGGTGATTAFQAMVNLLPSQTGNAGKVLATDGAGNLSWVVGGGSAAGVTSFSGGATGLTPSVATTGAIVLGGILALANGGTGATTQADAINALLPSQTGNPGKFLGTDGTNVSWVAGTPGSGSVTSVTVSGGTTGLTAAGNPVTTSGTITLGGTLSVSNGGTGLSGTPALGQILIGNGTNYTLNTLTAGANITITNGPGTITIAATGGGGGGGVSDISFGTTGLSPNTATTGSVTVTGTLNVANGGTGAATQTAALNNLLPSQAGNAGKCLSTDGSGVVSWQPASLALGNYGAITVSSATPSPTSWTLNNGIVTPTKLSTGGPSWSPAGNVVVTDLTVSNGSIGNITLTSSGVQYGVYASGGAGGFVALATPSGNVAFVPNTAGAGLSSTGPYTNTSDATLKENITTIIGCTDKIKQLDGVNFNWISDEAKSQQIGLIAQEVQKVFPEIVSVSAMTGKLGISYGSLVPVLINAIKELEARLALLEAK